MSAFGPTSDQSIPSRPDLGVGASAQRKASLRLLPIIGIGYGLAYMDRLNISFASLRMNSDLHFSATVYGLGAGLFFIAYAFCEIPSNLLMLKFGPRRWLARIMFTWGLLAIAMMFVRTPFQFYAVRLLLGMAEGRILSRCDLLPHSVVSGPHACACSEPLLRGAPTQFGSYGFDRRIPSGSRWKVRPFRLAMALSRGRSNT